MKSIAAALLGVVSLCAVGTANAADTKPLNITFIIYTEAGNIFWNPALTGVKEAAKDFNVDVDIQYGDADPVKVNTEIETAIANKVDGIALTTFVPDAFTANIKKARDAGISVVDFNIDDPKGAAGNERQAFIGQDLFAAGYTIGKRLVKDMHLGKGDKVFSPVEYPEATYAVQRGDGVKKALDEVGALQERIGTGAGFEEALPKMVQYLIGHPDTKAVISLGGTPTALAPKAVEEAKMTIPTGGFDLNAPLIEGLKAGKIVATIDQQGYYQGFLPIMMIANYVRYGLTPSDVNTGLAIVDKTNVDKVAANIGTYR